ncbi:UNVERIFIED_ORG: antitoxin ParD1/3/4 [Rhizobium aethiopicum]
MANDANSGPQLQNHMDDRVKSERDKRLMTLDLAIGRGIADAEAGRLKPIGDVPARLTARYDDRS